MPDKTKILSSAGTLSIGPAGGSVAAVGYTRGGVQISKSRSTREILADQTLYPLYITTTAEGFDINFRLLESSLANFKQAWGESATVGATSLSLGVYSEAQEEKEIQVYGTRKDGKRVKFTFYRCVLNTIGPYSFSRDDEALLESTYKATMNDATNSIGLVEEITP